MERPNARGQAAHQASFQGPHPAPLGRLRVVVSQEVKDAMDREVGDFAVIGTPRRASLPARRLDGEIDLAQKDAGVRDGGEIVR